jgi:hypothetical protein
VARKKRLSFEEPDKRGIPLAELITVHRQFSPKGFLPENLGDGFLLAENPVFRNVRTEAKALGFRFSRNNHGLYYTFPLMSLDSVIESRQIPYRDNFSWLPILEKSAPGQFTLTELKRSELQFNYVFHEAAHCIAHAKFFARARFSSLPKNADTLRKIMLGEAFANMVECLSAAFAEGEIGSYFLDGNCHFRSSPREVREIRRAARKWGYEKTAKVLLGGFLYANYLLDRLGRSELNRIAQFAGLEKGASIGKLASIGTELSEQFRTTTTHLHLIKMGFPARISSLMRGDPLAALLKKENMELKEQANSLAAIASRGL